MVHVALPFGEVFFPPVSTATEDGLLMLGGGLSPPWLIEAYQRGIFPWPLLTEYGPMLAWFSPDPRAILELDDFHVSHRLARRIRSHRYRVTWNTCFAEVVAGCAEPRGGEAGTWITPQLAEAYQRLHTLGIAQSVEVWREDQLVGGLYGVVLGGFFSGESMFHRDRDASKIALAALVDRLRMGGCDLFDIQQWTPHLASLGACEISRDEYLRRLQRAISARSCL